MGEPAVLSLWIGQDQSGVFLRGPRGQSYEPIARLLEPFADDLEQRLDARFPGGQFGFLGKNANMTHADPAQQDALIEWFETTRKAYLDALARIPEATK